MHHLTELFLSLDAFPVKAATPYIVQVLKHAKCLKKLNMETETTPARTHMLEVLEAMRHSPSLVSFEYSADRYSSRASRRHLKAYERKLLEILQEDNAQLTTVTFDLPGGRSGQWRNKIDYYLNLNRYGRAIARDHTSNLRTFVDLLCPPGLSEWAGAALWHLNREHGLLREAPGKWSHCERLVNEKSRKRKACYVEGIPST